MIAFINKYIGWRHWAVLHYNSIVENFFVLSYIAIITGDFSNQFILNSFFFLGFSILSTTYGYLVNDYADIDLDKAHGKSNTFSDDSRLKAGIIVAVMFLCSIVFALPFINSSAFVVSWGVWIFLSTFYSVRPVRFKERGKTGLFVAVFAQRVLPIIIVFAAFEYFKGLDVFLFVNLILFRGLASDINHQIEDYENDIYTDTNTSAVSVGKQKMEKYFRFVLEYEKISMLLVLGFMAFRIQGFEIMNLNVLLLLPAVYLVLYLLVLVKIRKSGEDHARINPFKRTGSDLFQFVHLFFPNVFLNMFLLLLLVFENYYFGIYIILFSLFFRLYKLEVIKNSFLGKIIFR